LTAKVELKKLKSKIFGLFVLAGLLIIPFGPVHAQVPEPSIFFSPDPAYIYTTGASTIEVNVDVANVIEIRGFDIQVSYDPAVVSIDSSSWEHGGFLKNMICSNQSFTEGSFRLVCSQINSPVVSGSGTVLRLTFTRVTVGQTALTFDRAIFSNIEYQSVYPQTDHGEIKVVDPTSLLYLPLIANMAVQGTLDRSGIKLNLAAGAAYGLSYAGWSTDNPGDNLLIASVAVDSYTVTVSHAGCLSASGTIVIPSGAASYNLPTLVLRSGNAQDADNIIDVYDLAIVNGAYGDFEANPEGDVNFDGQIDARDLALVAGNFGLTSEMAYAGWLT
jgi:Cohesin domain.